MPAQSSDRNTKTFAYSSANGRGGGKGAPSAKAPSFPIQQLFKTNIFIEKAFKNHLLIVFQPAIRTGLAGHTNLDQILRHFHNPCA
jgi:hypothetical protein